jgi:hypothetical protein
VIFGNLEMLLPCQLNLLAELENETEHEEQFGKVFTDFAPYHRSPPNLCRCRVSEIV